jgi:hypothetical protein
MNLIKHLLITINFLLIVSSIGYAQTIEIKLINGEEKFIFDRKYAEWLAEKLDSLEFLKKKTEFSLEIIQTQDAQMQDYIRYIDNQQKIIGFHKKNEELFNEQIESFKRSEIIHLETAKILKKEKRKHKFWKIVGIAGISTSAILTTIILIK